MIGLKTFAAEALVTFSTTAAISPSSSHLASAMLDPLPLANARVVVEFGAGTGAITRALLNAMPAESKLLAFEINSRFIRYLEQNLSDPRLILINASVTTLDQELRRRNIQHVDAAVSSLGLGLMPEQQRRRLFRKLMPFLRDPAMMTQYQYIQSLQFQKGRLSRLNLRTLLGRYFDSVESKVVWRNLPPAIVFTCRAKDTAGTGRPKGRRLDTVPSFSS